jgi:hypothetical protein
MPPTSAFNQDRVKNFPCSWMIKWYIYGSLTARIRVHQQLKIWGGKSKEKFGHPHREEGLVLSKSRKPLTLSLKEWRKTPDEDAISWPSWRPTQMIALQDNGCPFFHLLYTPNPVFGNPECSIRRHAHSTFTTAPSGTLYQPPSLTFYTVSSFLNGLHFTDYLEDGGNKLIKNIGIYIIKQHVSYPVRLESSKCFLLPMFTID